MFLNLAGGDAQALMGPLATTLKAISMGAVYFGALTYIGNAPNFMIKAIAEDRGVRDAELLRLLRLGVALMMPLLLRRRDVHALSGGACGATAFSGPWRRATRRTRSRVAGSVAG